MVNGAVASVARTPLDAVRTLSVPARSMERPLKVATPATAFTVAVPPSVPVPVDSETIVEAVLKSLFVRGQTSGVQLSLLDGASTALDEVQRECGRPERAGGDDAGHIGAPVEIDISSDAHPATVKPATSADWLRSTYTT